MSILIGRETRLVVQGITGREGEFHSLAMQAYGTNIVAGMTPGQGRPDGARGHGAGLRYRRGRGPRDRRQHLLHLRPGARSAGCRARGRRGRHQDDLLHHGGHPRPRHDPRRRGGPARRGPSHRAELSRRHVTRPGEGRHHPGIDPSRRARRRRVTLGHAHLRSRSGHDRRRTRAVNVHRDRWRSGHRDPVPRHPEAVQGRPGDRGPRPHRRDRRKRRGRGGRLGGRAPRRHPEGRLHRRTDRARGQADGSCRGHHLGRRRDRRVEGHRARGRRISRLPNPRPSSPTCCAPPATSPRRAFVAHDDIQLRAASERAVETERAVEAAA